VAFYEHVFEFITDRSKRLSARATIVVLSVVLILLLDNMLGFSYYYRKQKQLDILEKATVLLKDSTITGDVRNRLVQLQIQSLNKNNVIENLGIFIRQLFISSKKGNNSLDTKSTRNNFWFLFSASGIYILLTVILIPLVLIARKKTPFFRILAMCFIFLFIMIFTIWFNYWLMDKIFPDKLFGNWLWNYIANFLMQIALIIGLLWLSYTIEKGNKKTN
jgi:hypothetical protein